MKSHNRFLQLMSSMRGLLEEPAYVFSDNAVDRTETETATFLWDDEDADSDVVLTRDVEYDAANLKVSQEAWSLSNGPTVTNITTNQADNKTLARGSSNTLTITGTNFGAEDSDILVLLALKSKGSVNGPQIANSRGEVMVECVVTAINGGDTQITATVTLPNNYGGKIAQPGSTRILVANKKRKLQSLPYASITII